MGILDIFRKPNNQEVNYQAVLIQQMLKDIERLKNEVDILKDNNKYNASDINNKPEKPIKTELTELEQYILDTYRDKQPQNIEELSELTNIKINSLRVYMSKMKKKKVIISFNKYQ